jgi:Flp pilus assembly protein TadD
LNANRRELWIALFVVAATFAVFAGVWSNAFDNFDTPVYVAQNPHVQAGLSWSGVAWAFTTFTGGNWHPLTWLSIMLDCELFGLRPGWHHLASVAWHAASAGLLFLVLREITGARGPALLAALLFAVHPQHVEPVAWAALRKDVLSTFFLLATIAAYARYVRRPSIGGLLAALLLYLCGLMSKPMLVSVPLLLLALDVWPLQRRPRASWRSLAMEKIPFAVLAGAACAVTLVAQESQGAVGSFARFPLTLRVENAIVSCAAYLVSTFWPSGLAVFYPYPRSIPAWSIVAAAVAIAGITWLAWRIRRRHPFLVAGWVWYLVALIPVIGIVQVGRQARADRYTYVPHIGIFWIVAWGLAALVEARPRWRTAITAAAGVALALLAWTSVRQTAVWRTSTTLYEHALAVTSENSTVHFNLAATCFAANDLEGARRNYETTLAIEPDYPRANYSYGVVLGRLDRHDEATARFRRELELNPSDEGAHNSLGGELYRAGDLKGALEQFEAAAAIGPSNPEYACNAAVVLIDLGRVDEARLRLEKLVAGAPGYPRAADLLARLKAGKVGTQPR